jgi:hypothetical protein
LAFEEEIVLDMVNRDLNFTWDRERYLLYIRKMEDFNQFIDTVRDAGINIMSVGREIHEVFEETYEFLGN